MLIGGCWIIMPALYYYWDVHMLLICRLVYQLTRNSIESIDSGGGICAFVPLHQQRAMLGSAPSVAVEVNSVVILDSLPSSTPNCQKQIWNSQLLQLSFSVLWVTTQHVSLARLFSRMSWGTCGPLFVCVHVFLCLLFKSPSVIIIIVFNCHLHTKRVNTKSASHCLSIITQNVLYNSNVKEAQIWCFSLYFVLPVPELWMYSDALPHRAVLHYSSPSLSLSLRTPLLLLHRRKPPH